MKKGVAYELSIKDGTAIFNTRDNAQMANVGVLYVDKRKMYIKTIEKDKKLTITTEGKIYLFFVDDADANKGGFNVVITEVKK